MAETVSSPDSAVPRSTAGRGDAIAALFVPNWIVTAASFRVPFHRMYWSISASNSAINVSGHCSPPCQGPYKGADRRSICTLPNPSTGPPSRGGWGGAEGKALYRPASDAPLISIPCDSKPAAPYNKGRAIQYVRVLSVYRTLVNYRTVYSLVIITVAVFNVSLLQLQHRGIGKVKTTSGSQESRPHARSYLPAQYIQCSYARIIALS